ncbi:hypothetical protein RCL1_002963 [Eukaryota sp. TZLM3-RCL]
MTLSASNRPLTPTSFRKRSTTPLKRRPTPQSIVNSLPSTPASTLASNSLNTPLFSTESYPRHIDDSHKHSSFKLRLLELENSLKRDEIASSRISAKEDENLSHFLHSLTRPLHNARKPRPETTRDPQERSNENRLQRDVPEDANLGPFDSRKKSNYAMYKTFERSEDLVNTLPVPDQSIYIPEDPKPLKRRPRSCPRLTQHQSETSNRNFLYNPTDSTPISPPKPSRLLNEQHLSDIVALSNEDVIREAAAVVGNSHNFRKILRRFDTDDDGFLTSQEYFSALKAMNVAVPTGDLSTIKLVDLNQVHCKANSLYFNTQRRASYSRSRSPFATTNDKLAPHTMFTRKSKADINIVNPVDYLQTSKASNYGRRAEKSFSPRSYRDASLKLRQVHPVTEDLLSTSVSPPCADYQKNTATFDSSRLFDTITNSLPPSSTPRFSRPSSAPVRSTERPSSDDVAFAVRVENRLKNNSSKLRTSIYEQSPKGLLTHDELASTFKNVGVYLPADTIQTISSKYTVDGKVDAIKLADDIKSLSSKSLNYFDSSSFPNRASNPTLSRTTGPIRNDGFVLPAKTERKIFSNFPPHSVNSSSQIELNTAPNSKFSRPRSLPAPSVRPSPLFNHSQISLSHEEPLQVRRQLKTVAHRSSSILF